MKKITMKLKKKVNFKIITKIKLYTKKQIIKSNNP